jgi:C1A family cysteine protease
MPPRPVRWNAGAPLLPLHHFGPQMVFRDGGRRGLGWLRDVPDFRDSTIHTLTPRFTGGQRGGREHEKELALFTSVTAPLVAAKAKEDYPKDADNHEWCSPVEDQGNLGSCTANACVGMVEYMERRSGGQHIDGSRLFMYKATRKLLGWTGDTGAFLRTAMQALVLFGVPPEETWPYDVTTFDDEPDAYLYSYAANYKAAQYFRLDPAGSMADETLATIKTTLSRGYVAMFGFSVYSSMSEQPDIPFPGGNDVQRGGHAVLAVGYDDNHPTLSAVGHGQTEEGKPGALLIRNSWSAQWGDGGYGWLPYEYVTRGIAADFWTCTKQEWVDSCKFA